MESLLYDKKIDNFSLQHYNDNLLIHNLREKITSCCSKEKKFSKQNNLDSCKYKYIRYFASDLD